MEGQVEQPHPTFFIARWAENHPRAAQAIDRVVEWSFGFGLVTINCYVIARWILSHKLEFAAPTALMAPFMCLMWLYIFWKATRAYPSRENVYFSQQRNPSNFAVLLYIVACWSGLVGATAIVVTVVTALLLSQPNRLSGSAFIVAFISWFLLSAYVLVYAHPTTIANQRAPRQGR